MMPSVFFSKKSQMTSKCGKSKKKMPDELLVDGVTDVLTTF